MYSYVLYTTRYILGTIPEAWKSELSITNSTDNVDVCYDCIYMNLYNKCIYVYLLNKCIYIYIYVVIHYYCC